ncbi:nitroreductase [Neobacillus mesonae]|nr:nitroreductase [Neobacillus mesonae]
MSEERENLFQSRKSYRRFDKNRPIPQDTLENMLTDALRAPSWSNTQPWEVFVATGDILSEIKEAYIAAYENSEQPNTDVPVPQEWPEYIQDRSNRNGMSMFKSLGIDRNDSVARENNKRNNIEMFDGTALAIICQERTLTEWSTMDLGTFAGYLMLSAEHHGVQSVPAYNSILYPHILREKLSIPDHLILRSGIVFGYALEGHPYNKHKSGREPLHKMVHFVK